MDVVSTQENSPTTNAAEDVEMDSNQVEDKNKNPDNKDTISTAEEVDNHADGLPPDEVNPH